MTDPNEDLPPDTSRSVTSKKRPRKRATKAAPSPAKPQAEDIPEGAPREGTAARTFWNYGQAYARGIERATGQRVTAPAVRGPQDVIVRLLRAHCRDENDRIIKGPGVLTWLENTAYEFRSTADENEVRYRGGWTPYGLQRWLDDKRPVKREASSGRSHIAIGPMPSGWD